MQGSSVVYTDQYIRTQQLSWEKFLEISGLILRPTAIASHTSDAYFIKQNLSSRERRIVIDKQARTKRSSG